jgi:hypothetical protein
VRKGRFYDLTSIHNFANYLDKHFGVSIMPESTFSGLASLNPEEVL